MCCSRAVERPPLAERRRASTLDMGAVGQRRAAGHGSAAPARLSRMGSLSSTVLVAQHVDDGLVLRAGHGPAR